MAQTVQPLTSMRNRFKTPGSAGFSLVEMMVVVAIIGLVVLFAFPRAGKVYDHTMVRSARTQLTNLFNTTRTVARTSNRLAVLRRTGNVFIIERDSFPPSTGKDTLDPKSGRDLSTQYGVTVSGPDSIRLDPRGLLAMGSSSTTYTWILTRAGWSDSVMINGYGRVIR